MNLEDKKKWRNQIGSAERKSQKQQLHIQNLFTNETIKMGMG